MQIVIDIPKKVYKAICDKNALGCDISDIKNIIRNGTPLPKGHGRLIDGDRLRSMYSINRANFNTVVGIQKWIDNAPTVIGADEEE